MTTWRELCRELIDSRGPDYYRALERARAALAQPEPEAVRPTDEEIEEWAEAVAEVPLEALDPDLGGWQRCFNFKEFCQMVRAVLARWESPNLAEIRRSLGEPAEHQVAPVPVAVSERLPGAEDCDAKGRCWWGEDSYIGTWNLCTQNEAEEYLTWGTKCGWLPAHALPIPSWKVEA